MQFTEFCKTGDQLKHKAWKREATFADWDNFDNHCSMCSDCRRANERYIFANAWDKLELTQRIPEEVK